MASLLSNLADNPGEEIHKVKCKFGHDNEKANNHKRKLITNICV